MQKKLIIGLVALLFVTGCQTTQQPTYDYYDLYFTEDQQQFEISEITKAMKIAGVQRGWEITEVAPTEVQAFHENGSVSLTLRITYEADHFDIIYVDNTHMTKQNGYLNSRYYLWVENLTRDIRAEMLRISD